MFPSDGSRKRSLGPPRNILNVGLQLKTDEATGKPYVLATIDVSMINKGYVTAAMNNIKGVIENMGSVDASIPKVVIDFDADDKKITVALDTTRIDQVRFFIPLVLHKSMGFEQADITISIIEEDRNTKRVRGDETRGDETRGGGSKYNI